MGAKEDLFQIVRSDAFTNADPEQQVEFVQGYLQGQQPEAGSKQHFAAFDDATQKRIATAAIERVSESTLGEKVQAGIDVVAPAAGATIGATLGAPSLVGIGVLGAAGGIGGESLAELTRPLLTSQRGDLTNMLERSAETGLLDLTLGPVGEKVFTGVSTIVGGLRSTSKGLRPKDPKTGVRREDPDVKAARDVLEPRGGAVSPGQVKGRAFLENVLRNALGSEGFFTKIGQRNIEALDAFADEIGEKIGKMLPATQLGEYVNQQFTTAGKFARETGRKLFTDLNDKAGGIQTIHDDVLDFFDVKANIPAMKKIMKSFNAGPGGGKKGLETLLGRHTNGFGNINDANDAAAELFSAAAELKRKGDFGAANIATKMGAMIRKDIDTALNAVDPALKPQADAARAFWREEVVNTFETEALRPILRQLQKTPGQLGKTLIKGNIDTLNAVKKAAMKEAPGSPASWPEVQKSVLGILMSRSMTDLDRGLFSGIQKISGKTLMSNIRKLEEGNSGYMKTLMEGTDVTMKDFQKLANAFEVANRKVEGSGGVWIRLIQGSVIGTGALAAGTGIATGDPSLVGGGVGAAGAMWLTPKLLVHSLFNKRRMHNLAEGIIGGPKSAAFRRAVTFGAAGSDPAREQARRIIDQGTTLASTPMRQLESGLPTPHPVP